MRAKQSRIRSLRALQAGRPAACTRPKVASYRTSNRRYPPAADAVNVCLFLGRRRRARFRYIFRLPFGTSAIRSTDAANLKEALFLQRILFVCPSVCCMIERQCVTLQGYGLGLPALGREGLGVRQCWKSNRYGYRHGTSRGGIEQCDWSSVRIDWITL